MRIKSITLTNFQGITDFTAVLDGKSVSVYGDNGTGKTTLYNSFTWLLFDKNSTGVKGFSPKTKTADGEAHNLEHSVECVLETADGVITLKKAMSEVWKKKRGSRVAEFSGHTTEYFVNGVPNKKEDYEKVVDGLCGDTKKAKILSMPFYFSEELPWKDRRQTLLDVCGDVTDEDVIRAGRLDELIPFLRIPGGDKLYSIDEYREKTLAERKKINSELDVLPARIDEANRSVPEFGEKYVANLPVRKKEMTEELEKARKERVQLLAMDGSAAQRQAVAQARVNYDSAESAYMKECYRKQKEFSDQLRPRHNALRDIRNKLCITQNAIRKHEFELTTETTKRDELRSKYTETYQSVWTGSEICPTCGQRMPQEMIDEARARFNQERSRSLEDIQQRGKIAAAKIEDLTAGLTQLREQEEQLVKDEALLAKDVENAHEPTFPDFSETEEAKRLLQEIDKAKFSEVHTVDTSEIDKKISEIEAELDSVNKGLAAVSAAESTKKRIAELQEREKVLQDAFERTEKGLYLCDEFVRKKVSLLNAKINSRFETLRFKLFEEQVNGGLKETCEVLIPSPEGNMVPFGTANNAARINAGLEIISVLGEAWGLSIPVFVDNAESVTCLRDVDMQVIRLVVSEEDKKLRIEEA